MIRNLTEKRPGKRAVITVVLVVILAYSALLVGNSLQGKGSTIDIEGGTVTVTGHSYSMGDTADAATVAAQAAAAATAADAAKASSGLSFVALFDVVNQGTEPAIEEYSDIYERMVVYTARISLKVDDIDASIDEIKLVTVIHGGFISAVNSRDERGSVSIRVPQSRFHEAIEDLEELGEVISRDLQGEDVTEEYVDLDAQLTALEAQEARFLEILQMGKTVEDVLKVERELQRVREDIERIQGRINYLDSRVELSTITVSLSLEDEPVEVVQAWFPEVDWGVPVRTGLAVLFTITQGMLTMIIVVGPFLLVGYGVVRGYRRHLAVKAVEVKSEESPVS
jgi:hypothetical protein